MNPLVAGCNEQHEDVVRYLCFCCRVLNITARVSFQQILRLISVDTPLVLLDFKDGDSRLLQNVVNSLHCHAAYHLRSLESSSTLLGEPQISEYHVWLFGWKGKQPQLRKVYYITPDVPTASFNIHSSNFIIIIIISSSTAECGATAS